MRSRVTTRRASSAAPRRRRCLRSTPCGGSMRSLSARGRPNLYIKEPRRVGRCTGRAVARARAWRRRSVFAARRRGRSFPEAFGPAYKPGPALKPVNDVMRCTARRARCTLSERAVRQARTTCSTWLATAWPWLASRSARAAPCTSGAHATRNWTPSAVQPYEMRPRDAAVRCGATSESRTAQRLCARASNPACDAQGRARKPAHPNIRRAKPIAAARPRPRPPASRKP